MALDRYGEHDRSAAFHRWVGRVVAAEAPALAEPSREEGHYLRARYPLDFPDVPAGEDDWGNFQLDGPALWLVALADHVRRGGERVAPYRDAALAVGRYLARIGDEPCNDCWEENEDEIHGSTLAAIAGGFRALVALGLDEFASELDVARKRLLDLCSDGTTLLKWHGSREVDSSLLWTAVPCRALDPDDPLMRRTEARVHTELREGRIRYRGDAYFGGGEWPILAGLDGWHAVARRDEARARMQLAWIEAHAAPDGTLPEQVDEHLETPAKRARWVDEFGPPAHPLLWSHAMHLILAHALAHGVD